MEILDFLKRLFFVPRCAVCHRQPEAGERDCLCRTCRLRYENEKKRTCPICRRRYDYCHCLPQFASPYIAGYARVAHYSEESAAGRLVLSAKDRTNSDLYDLMATEMASLAQKRGFTPDVIVYVPCSERSFVRKGFDHGRHLARALGAKLEKPVADCFVRGKGSEQKQLGAAERLENSKNSLSPKRNAEKAVAGRRVLLVDDVMTTGASALVASVYLHEMGATHIDFIAFGGR